jgi:hypothetical protein
VFRRHRREDADQSRRNSGAEQDQAGQDQADLDRDEFDRDGLARDGLARDEADFDDELAEPGDDDEVTELDDELDDDEFEDGADLAPRRAPVAARRGEDLGDPATWTRLRDSSASAGAPRDQTAGPWDAASGYPDGERMDFGSLLVPIREGFDIQVNLDEEAGIWIAIVYGDSALQLQAFAAPKTSGLWDEVRQEIAAEVAKAGGESEPGEGPFGTELLARLNSDGQPGQPPQLLRFMGADGPRWFLRGLITGQAAARPELAQPFEAVFADVVVVRGDHAEPVRKALDIQLPEEARQAIEQQMEAEGQDGMPNPFERGPEITEIR